MVRAITDTRAGNYLRRRDSGRGPTGDFFRGGADRYGAAAASGECADPLPRIARGVGDYPEVRPNAGGILKSTNTQILV